MCLVRALLYKCLTAAGNPAYVISRVDLEMLSQTRPLQSPMLLQVVDVDPNPDQEAFHELRVYQCIACV